MIATFLLIGIEQRIAGFPLDNQRQFPCEVKGVAHTTVIALPLPHRHDVRGIARQQYAINTETLRQSRVVGVDTLANQFNIVRIRQHFA